jgi:hypothetical protein
MAYLVNLPFSRPVIVLVILSFGPRQMSYHVMYLYLLLITTQCMLNNPYVCFV